MTWTRRIFLKESLAGWLALVVGPVAYTFSRRGLQQPSSSGPQTLMVGSLDELDNHGSKLIQFGADRVIIGRSPDGSVHAVSAICTHLGCSVRFEQEGGQNNFACNCHESKFDLDGENLSGPAAAPLRRYQVEVVERQIRLSGVGDSEDL